MERIWIWGAGASAAALVGSLDENAVTILGFIDTDRGKRGERLLGYEIMEPGQLAEKDYDFVFISSASHQDEIYESAVLAGVPAEKIVSAIVTGRQMARVYQLFSAKGLSYVNYLVADNVQKRVKEMEGKIQRLENKLRGLESTVKGIENKCRHDRERNVNLFLKEHYERKAADFIAEAFIESGTAPGREVIFENRQDYWDYVVDRAKARDGLFLEFGVYKGKSVNYIAERIGERPVYGFDSFEGLPEHWHPGYGKGVYGAEGDLPACRDNVVLVKGWFQETLPSFLDAHRGEKCAYVHIDCDLYSSAKYVLTMLRDFVRPGTVIDFDEFAGVIGWQHDESKAWDEFVRETGLKFRYVACSFNRGGDELTEAVAVEIE